MNFSELRRRIWYLFNRDQASQELEEEMRSHVQMRAESLRKVNVGDELAFASAQRRFGNTTELQQRSRDSWGFGRFDDFTHDIRFAFRRLKQQRGFTLAVVVVMAIGIGATTAMFSAVDAVLLRPLPFPNADQLVVLPTVHVPLKTTTNFQEPLRGRQLFGDVADMHDLFSHVAAYGTGGLNISDDAHPLRANTGVVTADFFNTLGISPFKGRAFLPEEGVPDAPNVVLLSYGLWQSQYGGRDIDKLSITLNKRSYQVVGVMPPGFNFPEHSDLWVPMTVPNTMQTFEAFQLSIRQTVIARLANGRSMSAAAAKLLSQWKLANVPKSKNDSVRFNANMAGLAKIGIVMPIQNGLARERAIALYILLGATALLLLIACANVTNLLLANAAARSREIAVRQVLGATRTRIVRQLLTESVILALGGAIFGMLLASIAVSAMKSLTPEGLSGVVPIEINLRVLGFATALAMTSAVAFGLWPAVGSARNDAGDTIKSGGGHGATSRKSGRLRRALVGAELGLTVVLLVGAGIMLRSFQEVVSRNIGIRTENVGTMKIAFPMSGGRSTDHAGKINAILDQLSRTPSIEAAGVVSELPLSDSPIQSIGIKVDGVSPADEPKGPIIPMSASGGYFTALGIPLVNGRVFSELDESPNVHSIIISASVAKGFWPNANPVGRTLHMPRDSAVYSVVGVVADVPHEMDQEAMMQVYRTNTSSMRLSVEFVVRSRLMKEDLLRAMTSAVHSVDRQQAVFNLRMMDEMKSSSIAPRRTSTLFISAFALLALVLACVGVYAVVSYAVSNRSRELGIRSALGATGQNLAGMISREMIPVVAIGLIVGLGGAWMLSKMLESLVYGVQVHDVMTFVLVPLALLFPATLATFIPARRVMRVNPAEVMRAD